MYKSAFAVAAVAIGFAAGQAPRNPEAALQFKEERMFVEYSPSAGIATVIVEAESEEAVSNVEVCQPGGASSFRMRAENGRFALSGFVLESQEADLATIFDSYPAGTYVVRGRTVSGQSVTGSAEVAHELVAAPELVYPRDGARGVPSSDLTVTWNADGGAAAYRIVLEQDENDGLTIQLPPGSDSLRIPDEMLAPRSEYHLEIAAIAPNGNRTVSEIHFTTE
jgi:hypothetical protein